MTNRETKPGKTEADILDELRSLSITAAHELLSGFDRLKQLRDDWEVDENGHGDESRKQRERAKGLAYELARHEIKHAEKILSLSHAQADMLFDHARRLVQRMRAEPRCAPFGRPRHPPRVVDLEAHQSNRDEPATAIFAITNPFDRDADVRFADSTFTTRNGEPVVGFISKPTTTLEIVPARATRELPIKVRINGEPPCEAGVYFAELEVFLVGDVEQLVARRLLRLRVLAMKAE